MLAGLIRDDERTVMDGVPGLSDLPVVGRLFAHNRKETQETDILLTLTPHIIRVLDLTEADLRPFRVERDAGSPLLEAPERIAPLPEAGYAAARSTGAARACRTAAAPADPGHRLPRSLSRHLRRSRFRCRSSSFELSSFKP